MEEERLELYANKPSSWQVMRIYNFILNLLSGIIIRVVHKAKQLTRRKLLVWFLIYKYTPDDITYYLLKEKKILLKSHNIIW